MRITLIKPTIGHNKKGTYREKANMEPLALSVIASITPDDIEVKFYDDRVEKIPYNEKTDLVAVTVDTFTAKRAYEISTEYKKHNIPVILGGPHPTLIPKEASKYADCVYTGDLEGSWHEVISDLRGGDLKKNYKSAVNIPQQAKALKKDIFKGKKLIHPPLIQFSRGCKMGCTFCAVTAFYKQTSFHRPIKHVITEIKNSGRKVWIFVDDNIVSDHVHAKELFEALIPLKIKWVSQTDISVAHDPELMELLVKSGCIGLFIGFESINRNSLREMHKTINLIDKRGYDHSLKILRDHGLQIWAAFTFGHDADTRESIRETFEFAMKHKFLMVDFNLLIPYPNTSLYNTLKEQNRLLFDGKWWLHPDYRFGNAAFIPKNMSPVELEKDCSKAYRDYLKFSSLLKRVADKKTHLSSLRKLFIYGLSNFLSYNETVKKRGVILGKGQP